MSKQTGILRPLGLALVLAIGFGAVFGVVAAWGVSIWEGLYRTNVSDNKGLVVRADGTPLIQRYVYNGMGSVVTYYELGGREVPGSMQKEGENLLGGAVLAVPGR